MTEPEAREHCRVRDRGRCRVPGCAAVSRDLHHLVYRSHSVALQWDPANLISLCAAHHALVHAGDLEIAGNADHVIEVTGNDFDFVALACHETGR
jgi:5-methylcytosine-specific restriction endonuclease McrA